MSEARKLKRFGYTEGTEDDIRRAELIVTQAWSLRRDGAPGKGNEAIATVAKNLHEKFALPIFLQEEAALALEQRYPQVPIAGVARDPSKTGGRSTLSWNTWAVANAQAEYCREHGISKVVVVAHYLHMKRALKAYKKLGLEAVAAPMPREWEAYRDPKLVHWTTRRKSPFFFKSREFLLGLLEPMLASVAQRSQNAPKPIDLRTA